MVLSTQVDPGPHRPAAGREVQRLRTSADSHSLRAGIDFRQHYRTQIQNGGLTSGNFTFANNYVRKDEDGITPAGTLGLVWAAFLLGMPNGMSVDTNDTFALMNPYYAWYAQDTWRVTRNLTLTLGLRMEYERGPTERYNRALSYFDPNLELPITAAAQAAYARNPLPEVPASQFIVQGGSVYAGRNGATARALAQRADVAAARFARPGRSNPKTDRPRRLRHLLRHAERDELRRRTSTDFRAPRTPMLTNDFGADLAGRRSARTAFRRSTDPFPVRADGTRFDVPSADALGAMARVGQGFTLHRFRPRASARAALARRRAARARRAT